MVVPALAKMLSAQAAKPAALKGFRKQQHSFRLAVVAEAAPAAAAACARVPAGAEHIPHPPETMHASNYHHATPECGYQFFMPSVSYMGPGCLKAAAAAVKKLGLAKGLVVTDSALAKSPALKVLHAALVENSIDHALYAGVTPNPTVGQVEEGLKALRDKGCDFLISFGGGSPHDCAKAVGIVATNGGSIRDYEGVDKSTKPMLPLVSINTTAGTAAEMTRFSIITDTERHVKMAIIDSKCTPTIAVDDPVLMINMPKGLTAATGMDALTHCIEAYVSTASTPITDACALHGIRLISTYLRDAVAKPDDLRARDMMSYAQYLAGMAFNSASLGYVHAMAHQLGGLYDLPHGVCNAVLLPVVQEFNAQACPELYLDIAEAMGCMTGGRAGANPQQAVGAVLGAIRQLSVDVGIPRNLRELGVMPEDFDVLASNAMKDACGLTNPRQPSKEEVVEMFRKAYEQ